MQTLQQIIGDSVDTTLPIIKRLEQRSRLFSTLGRRLGEAATIRRAAEIVLEVADELVGWDSCSVDLYAPELDTISCVLAMDIIDGRRTEISGSGLNATPSPRLRQTVFLGAQLILREDFQQRSPDCKAFGDQSRPSASLMYVPLRYMGRNTGVLTIQSYDTLAYTEEDLGILQDLADHCGGVMERIQALEKYQSIFEQAVEGISQTAPDGRFLKANPALTRMLGYSSTKTLTAAISDIGKQLFVRPAAYLEFKRQVEQNGTVRNFEAEFYHRNGSTIRVSINAHVVLDALGAAHYYDSTIEDITERRGTETFLHSILQNLPMTVFIKEPKDLRFVMWNKANEELCGYTAAEIVGKNDHDLFPKEQADVFVAQDREALREGKLVQNEEEMLTRHHGKRILLTRKVPIFDEHGEPLYLLGISEDITERKEAEVELAYERDLLRSLLDNSPDYVYFKDSNSRFIRSSRTLSERLGLNPQDIIGKCDFDLFVGDHAREAYKDEQEIVKSGRPVVGKIEKEVWKNGIESWVLTNKMPLRNKTGEIIGTFGISKDITAIKDAEAKLKRVHEQLVETSRLAGMTEVATNVLHNVGNVLNSVNISCSVVSDKMRQSKVANLTKAVALLQAHSRDLPVFLVNDPKGKLLPGYLSNLAALISKEQREVLLELASLNNNIDHIKEIVAMQQSYAKVSGLLESLPLVDLVEDALRMNAGAMERHHVKIVREYSDVPPVLVDKHKVLQILVNLIRNAKYALDEQRHANKVLTLRVGTNESGKVHVMVIDNGVGIPPENLSRIFGHGFTTRKEGHGFGLHSGSLAAKELGGSIHVQSEGTGQGAIFTLELPCQADKNGG